MYFVDLVEIFPKRHQMQTSASIQPRTSRLKLRCRGPGRSNDLDPGDLLLRFPALAEEEGRVTIRELDGIDRDLPSQRSFHSLPARSTSLGRKNVTVRCRLPSEIDFMIVPAVTCSTSAPSCIKRGLEALG